MSETLTPEQIAELRVLDVEATPGPWESIPRGSEGYWTMAPARKPRLRNEREPVAMCGMLDWDTDKQNALLIAAMRNAFPALLDAYEERGRLRGQLDAAEQNARLRALLRECSVVLTRDWSPAIRVLTDRIDAEVDRG